MNWFQRTAQDKVLIIARGPSGSGKSTMVEKLKKELGAPVFSTDDAWISKKTGRYEYDPSVADWAHWATQEEVKKAMQTGHSIIIVDNTNTQLWEMKPYVEMARKHDYSVSFKEPDWDENLKTPEGQWNVDFLESMQQTGNRQEIGKIIPREVLEKMVGKYEHNPTVESVLKSEKPV